MSGTNLLTPTPTNIQNQPVNIMAPNVGSTWAGTGLNIDLDNIMMDKRKNAGTAPSMNQLAVHSPQHVTKQINGKFSTSNVHS